MTTTQADCCPVCWGLPGNGKSKVCKACDHAYSRPSVTMLIEQTAVNRKRAQAFRRIAVAKLARDSR